MDLTTEFEESSSNEELARLARALRLAQGFKLYIARSLPGESRQYLMGELSASLDGDTLVFDAERGLENLLSAVEMDIATGVGARAVCVTGLEKWIRGSEGASSAFVRNLNASRDRFARSVPLPMVIWAADHILQAIQHGAPDFFSVASGIYLFPSPPAARLEKSRQSESFLAGSALWLRELAEVDDRLVDLGSEASGTAMVDRISTSNRKVALLFSLGRLEEALSIAKPINREALLYLGPEHPDALDSANNLASLYESVGRYAEAEPLYLETLDAQRRVLGPEHPDTLTGVNNLAGLFESTERYAEAEPLYLETLDARRRVLGPEHPDTLSSANNLAFLYNSTGRYAEAEPLYLHALDAYRRIQGPEHPDTLSSANNLASLYESVGRYAEAEPLYLETLDACRRVLGPEHPDTLSSANNLAYLYRKTGRYAEALATLERLIVAARQLVPSHPVRKTIESAYADLQQHPAP